jgi:hypothetical protein
MRRLRHLLYWQAQFDSKRPLLWLCGAIYLLFAGPASFAVFSFIHWRGGFPVTGSAYLANLTIINAFASLLLVSFLASRAADERRNGFLAILQMTDIHPAALTAFRFLGAMWTVAGLWVMRLPLDVWCYHMGSVRLMDFVSAEVILFFVTVVGLSISMACSQVARSSQLALTMIGSVLVGTEALFYFPRLFMGAVRLAFGPVAGILSDFNEWALVFSRWSLVGRVRYPPADADEWWSFLPGGAEHLVIALVALALTWRWTFSNVIPDDHPREAAISRPPRRVVGDALAWQAIHVHISRQKFRRASLAFDLVLLACLVVGLFTLPPVGAGVLALGIAFRALATAAMRAGICMFYEIQDQTLSTLALLPRAPLEYFYSWRAGGFRASKIEYLSAAVATPIVWWNMGEAAPGLLGFMVAMALSPPFGFLNSLCRFEWAVFYLSLWIFPLGFAVLAISIYAGYLTSVWGGFTVFCLLALVYHQIIIRQLPYYFQKAVERG